MREPTGHNNVVSINDFLYLSFDEIVKGIQMLLHQSSNLQDSNSVTNI